MSDFLEQSGQSRLQHNDERLIRDDFSMPDFNDRVTMISTTGFSEFSSDGVSDWQLLGMEFRRDQVESEVFYQEFQFNLELFDGKVDFVTGLNYFKGTYANNAQAFGRGYWGAGGPPSGINTAVRNAIAEYRARPREYGLTFQYNFF